MFPCELRLDSAGEGLVSDHINHDHGTPRKSKQNSSNIPKLGAMSLTQTLASLHILAETILNANRSTLYVVRGFEARHVTLSA